MKQELLKGGTDQLKLGLKDHGRDVAPYSCTIRILEGSTVLESGTPTAGAYTPTSAVVGELHADLVAEWTYVENSGEPSKKKAEQFDVVLFKLVPVVTDSDVLKECAALSTADYVHHGEISGTPSSSAIIDQSLIGSLTDYDGGIITFLSGTLAEKQFVVSSFTASTGTIGGTFGSAPAASDTFTLRRSFKGEIDQAWEDIYDKLIQQCAGDSYATLNQGNVPSYASRPYLIITPDRLRRPHLMRALEKIFRGIATDTTGVDWARAEYYAKEFEAAWSGLKLTFASGSDDSAPVAEKEVSGAWGFGR